MLSSNYLKYFLMVSITILTIFIFSFFIYYQDTLEEVIIGIEDNSFKQIESLSTKIETRLKEILKSDIKNPLEIDKETIQKAQKVLELFSSQIYPFVYAVSKDKEDKYRYLFDGSFEKQERGEFLQKFDPESGIWDKAYDLQKPQKKLQIDVQGVRTTFVYPVVYENKTRFIIAFDFSMKEHKILEDAFSPIKMFLISILVSLLVTLILAYAMAYLFYKQRKKTAIDSLTNLPNRYYLSEITNRIRLNEVSVALLDLDHFKKVNDKYGHLAGDKALKKISSILAQSLRAHDILIRYGGEEFLIFIAHNGDFSVPEKVLRRIMEKVAQESIQISKNNSIKITISVGLNPHPHLSRSLKDAVELADKMLYLAKVNGRNRIEVHKDNPEKSKIYHAEDITNMINDGKLVAFFQPIAESKTGKIVKYEALARVLDEGTIHLPIEFLPYIKSTTAYRLMSKVILTKAFDTIKKHNIAVSVNFDVENFLDVTIYETIYDVILQRKDLANMLTLELLEDTQIKDISEILKRIEALQNLGVKIAIDDFGSGYSNFDYLLNIRPDFLKIDGSIIRMLNVNPYAKEIIKAILQMCAKLDIKVIAEFVSDEEKSTELAKMGIDYLQGFFIGKPSPNLVEEELMEQI